MSTLVGDTSELPNASDTRMKDNYRLRVYVEEGRAPFAGRLFARVLNVFDFHYLTGTRTEGEFGRNIYATAQQCRELAELLVLAADYIDSPPASDGGANS